jgi:hypothetical protein
MYECYNEGYNYLRNKYGYKRLGLTSKSYTLLQKCKNKKEKEELLASFTDDNYKVELNPITEHEDRVISTLLNQYYFGRSVRKELYLRLKRIRENGERN